MINQNTVFRKTELGNAEIASRKLGLRAELRRLLILVDGRSSASRLASVVRFPDLDNMLLELQAHGLIDVLDGAVAPPLSTAPTPLNSASTIARGTPTMSQSTGDSSLLPSQEQFVAARSAAVRFINDTLGPSGESFAIKLERARTPQDLRVAITEVRQSMERMVGASVAQRFLDHVRAAVK
jgi:hypothetical protein